MTLPELQRRLAKVTDSSLNKIELSMVVRHQEEYIYQQQRQMYAGIGTNGKPMRTHKHPSYPYSHDYSVYKRKYQPSIMDRVTLLLFGRFYDTMYIVPKGSDTFEISSRVLYQGFLEAHYAVYSDGIWGINGKYKSAYLNQLQPIFLEEFITEFL